MNGAEIHLMINHIPILGTFVGLGLLAWGLARRQESVVRAAMGLLVIFALFGVATFLTGEPAEHVVEDAIDVSHDIIEHHEHFAVWGLVGSGAAGLLALVGLLMHRGRPVGRGFAKGLLVVAVIAAGLLSYTAYLGGRINHPEIRRGTTGAEQEHDGEGESPESAPPAAPSRG